MNRYIAWLRIPWQVGAGLLGFVVVEAATTAGFTPLGGIIEVTAPFRIQLLATLVAIVSGLLGGFAASLAGGGRSLLPVSITAGIIAIESTYIIAFRRGANPIWYELFGAATLLGGTIVGGVFVRRIFLARRARVSSPA